MSKIKQYDLFGSKIISQTAELGQQLLDENGDKTIHFNKLKTYAGKTYTGMNVGGIHRWKYEDASWVEQKLTPDQWKINYSCMKTRTHTAPKNTGAEIGSEYHWYIIADQKAMKLNSNQYKTEMDGFKFKIGHKRPNWKHWSYEYQEKLSYKQRVIEILENILNQLKNS